MHNHHLPPHAQIEQLEPYILITTLLIVVMGVLGGWAGNAWPWVMGVSFFRLSINLGLVFFRRKGYSFGTLIIINAVTNYMATLAIILLTSKIPNPFWLLFMVETVASALYRSMHGVLFNSISAFFLLVYIFITQGLDRTGLASGCIYSMLSLIIGLVSIRGLELFYNEHENRVEVEKAVRQSEYQLRQITENMLDLIVQIDVNGVLNYLSPSFRSALGYRPQELYGRSIFEFIYSDDIESAKSNSKKAIDSSLPVNIKIRLRHEDGHYIWFECIGKPMIDDGRLVGAIFSGRDITERIRIEEDMHISLQEKEVLLKEIHHRVKNNLQIISSLLNLQSQNIQDPDSLSAFRESQDRVHSMALIHEKLYQSENLAGIDFSQYINNLVTYLVRSYRANSTNITLNIHCDPIFLDIDTSVPCGLILNELISNALKHAFPESESGEIRINMQMAEDNQVNLIVADNGKGFPPELDPLCTPSLGLKLVSTLVDQLGGELRFENNPGLQIAISFTPIHHH